MVATLRCSSYSRARSSAWPACRPERLQQPLSSSRVQRVPRAALRATSARRRESGRATRSASGRRPGPRRAVGVRRARPVRRQVLHRPPPAWRSAARRRVGAARPRRARPRSEQLAVAAPRRRHGRSTASRGDRADRRRDRAAATDLLHAPAPRRRPARPAGGRPAARSRTRVRSVASKTWCGRRAAGARASVRSWRVDQHRHPACRPARTQRPSRSRAPCPASAAAARSGSRGRSGRPAVSRSMNRRCPTSSSRA